LAIGDGGHGGALNPSAGGSLSPVAGGAASQGGSADQLIALVAAEVGAAGIDTVVGDGKLTVGGSRDGTAKNADASRRSSPTQTSGSALNSGDVG